MNNKLYLENIKILTKEANTILNKIIFLGDKIKIYPDSTRLIFDANKVAEQAIMASIEWVRLAHKPPRSLKLKRAKLRAIVYHHQQKCLYLERIMKDIKSVEKKEMCGMVLKTHRAIARSYTQLDSCFEDKNGN